MAVSQIKLSLETIEQLKKVREKYQLKNYENVITLLLMNDERLKEEYDYENTLDELESLQRISTRVKRFHDQIRKEVN